MWPCVVRHLVTCFNQANESLLLVALLRILEKLFRADWEWEGSFKIAEKVFYKVWYRFFVAFEESGRVLKVLITLFFLLPTAVNT